MDRDRPALVRLNADGEFVVNGRSFVPQGVNSYPLLDLAARGRIEAVEQVFDDAVALGRPLVRTNAFCDVPNHPARLRNDDDSLREEAARALDSVVDAANRKGVRLLLTLTNHWKDYGGAPAVVRRVAPREQLPVDAFYQDPRAIGAQRRYVRAVLERWNVLSGVRYGADTTILAWELANEARLTRSPLDPRILARWARTMSDEIRDAGATQLVSWGGSGFFGRFGEDLRVLAAGAGIDILTTHLYPGTLLGTWMGERLPRAQARAAGLLGALRVRRRATFARRVKLALLVEELGWRRTTHPRADELRAEVLHPILREARRWRVGVLPWMIAERGRENADGHLIRPFVDAATTRVLLADRLRRDSERA